MATSLGTVLIVGGCGFLGHNIIKDIQSSSLSTSIHVLDFNTTLNVLPNVTYHTADITVPSSVTAVFQKVKPTTVIHTASPHPLQRNPDILYKVNVLGTQNIVEAAQAVKTVKAFVYTSSSSVVHDHRSELHDVTEESAPLLHYPEQPEIYSHTKALGEELVIGANRDKGNMCTAALRPASIYGEGDRLVIANFCRNAYTGRAKNQLGDGKNLMDCTYVVNCAYAHVLVAQGLVKAADAKPLPADEKVEGEAFFIRNDERYGFWDLNRLAADMAGYPVKKEDIRAIPLWLVMIGAFIMEWLYWIFTMGKKEPILTPRVVRIITIDRTFSIDKIKKRLGYKSKFSTEEGFRRSVDWYMTNVYAVELEEKKEKEKKEKEKKAQ